jgi:hypothetical protein
MLDVKELTPPAAAAKQQQQFAICQMQQLVNTDMIFPARVPVLERSIRTKF